MPRSRAIIFVLSLLSLLHVYIGMRLIPAMVLPGWGVAIGVLLLVLSTFLMPMGLIASRTRQGGYADRLAWVGLVAMGFFSSLLLLTLLRDGALLLVSLFSTVTPALARATAFAVPLSGIL